MVYTERTSRVRQFHVAPAMEQLYSAVTTSVDIQNALCEAADTHSEWNTTRAQWVCSEAENSAVVVTVKRLGLFWR